MIKYLAIFPPCKNVHLIKDIGMIPFVLHKELNFESTIASYDNGEYPYLNKEVSGLKHVYIKKRFNNDFLNVLVFLLFNFKKYDVVQCYHFGISNLLILFSFKFLKMITFSKGLTYIKLDARETGVKNMNMNFVYNFLSKQIDLITVETLVLYEYFKKTNLLARKVEYLPNGFYDEGFKNTISFDSKENLIITVGRIGDYEKNNQILLEAFRQFSFVNKEWKLELIGPVEEEFKPYVLEYFETNPHLKDSVFFKGNISDRQMLQDKYNKAKIFVLTSRIEGFPLVYLEAVKAGCSIVTSAVAPAYDITDYEKYGAIFPIDDADLLFEKLVSLTSNNQKLEDDCLKIQEFAYEKFYWPILVKKIANKLNII